MNCSSIISQSNYEFLSLPWIIAELKKNQDESRQEFSWSSISDETTIMNNFHAKDQEALDRKFQKIFTILKIHPNRRRRKQLMELQNYFKDLDFFK